MKLYVTFTSPYARLARILVLEKALEDRVEIIAAKTRATNSPYYQINPSGRVPYLVDDSGEAKPCSVPAMPSWISSGCRMRFRNFSPKRSKEAWMRATSIMSMPTPRIIVGFSVPGADSVNDSVRKQDGRFQLSAFLTPRGDIG